MKLLSKLASRNSAEILNNVFVKDGLATATDCDVWMQAPCELQDGFYDGSAFDVKALRVDGFSEADLPQSPDFGDKLASFTLSKDDFKYLVAAMSKEQARYHIGGIVVYQDKIAATDGHRLHVINRDIGAAIPENGVVIPRELVNYAVKAKGKEFEFIACENAVSIRDLSDGTLYFSKYLDVTFPAIDRVIPEAGKTWDYDFSALNGKQLTTWKKLDKSLASGNFHAVLNGAGLYLKADHTESIEYCKEGFDGNIGINFTFLAVLPPQGRFSQNESGDPVRFDCDDKTSVVMPLRV